MLKWMPCKACRRSFPAVSHYTHCGVCRLVRERDKNRDKNHRRRLAEVTGEFVSFAYIAARDRWTCQLCRKRVGKTYVYPHPRSATLDHIIPLSGGGTHTVDNVQLAHAWCNISKGTRRTGDQLRLIG